MRDNVCSNTWDLIQDAHRTPGSPTSKAKGQTDAQIKADAGVVRPVGPQRLRPRRQLQRAGRLHRPLPDRPRRRRPGRRRPLPGRGRHLVAPLEGVPEPGGPTGPADNKDRRHPDRHHRPVGRATTRSSPRTAACRCSPTSTATTSACPTTTTPPAGDNAVNWWTLMAQSRARRPRTTSASAPAPADLGAWDKLQLGWLDYEIVVAGQTSARSTSARTSTTRRRPRALVVVLPKKNVTRSWSARPAGPSSGGQRHRRRPRRQLTRSRHPPGGHGDADLPGALEHRGLRPDACDYAYVEVDDGAGFTAIPGIITKPAEGNGIDGARAAAGLAGDVRPVGLRRQDGPAAAPLRDRRRRAGQRPRRCRRASSSTTSRSPPTAPRCSPTAPRPATTAGRSTGSPRSAHQRDHAATTTTTSRPTAPTRPTTST